MTDPQTFSQWFRACFLYLCLHLTVFLMSGSFSKTNHLPHESEDEMNWGKVCLPRGPSSKTFPPHLLVLLLDAQISCVSSQGVREREEEEKWSYMDKEGFVNMAKWDSTEFLHSDFSGSSITGQREKIQFHIPLLSVLGLLKIVWGVWGMVSWHTTCKNIF